MSSIDKASIDKERLFSILSIAPVNKGLKTEDSVNDEFYDKFYADYGLSEEIFDLVSVANGDKPVSSVSFDEPDSPILLYIFEYCEDKGVKCIIERDFDGFIFYLPTVEENYQNALKLAYISHSKNRRNLSYAMGKVLGYSEKNLKYFYTSQGYSDTEYAEIKRANIDYLRTLQIPNKFVIKHINFDQILDILMR